MTEDWSNDAENAALLHRNTLHYTHIQKENSYVFLFFLIFHNITVLLYFWSIKRILGEQKGPHTSEQ